MKKYNITVNGTTYEVVVEEAGQDSAPAYTPAPVAAPVAAPAAPKAQAAPAPKASAPAASAGAKGNVSVTAPMPGTILDVLEAMKMENDIPAPQDGVIASVNVQKGATVNANDVLVSLN